MYCDKNIWYRQIEHLIPAEAYCQVTHQSRSLLWIALCISDVRYEHVARITPLMSAVPVWESLKDFSDPTLHGKIQTLLMVQVFVWEWWMICFVEFKWDEVKKLLSLCVQVCRCVCQERIWQVGQRHLAVAGRTDWCTRGGHFAISLKYFFKHHGVLWFI